VVPLGGAFLATAAWLGLVVLAVRLGREASDVWTWASAVAATVAAIACLLVVFALLSRAWAAAHDAAPLRRTPGRRRL